MSEDKTLSRTAGATVVTLVAVACAAGLADALRRRRERTRARTPDHSGPPAPRHTAHSTPAIPRQRRTGPHVEAVPLTDAERDAFAVLVRRFGEGG